MVATTFFFFSVWIKKSHACLDAVFPPQCGKLRGTAHETVKQMGSRIKSSPSLKLSSSSLSTMPDLTVKRHCTQCGLDNDLDRQCCIRCKGYLSQMLPIDKYLDPAIYHEHTRDRYPGCTPWTCSLCHASNFPTTKLCAWCLTPPRR